MATILAGLAAVKPGWQLSARRRADPEGGHRFTRWRVRLSGSCLAFALVRGMLWLLLRSAVWRP
ncbi:MAG: hypothetical protein WAK84_02290 [Candidatus Cybelea sp.]